MPVKSADKATRDAILDILSLFLKDYDNPSGSFAELLCKVYDRYQLGNPGASGLESMLSNCSDVEMGTLNQFLHLEPIKNNILPLVTLQSSSNWVHFRIYALLTMLDENCDLQSLAIRFETDEGYPGVGYSPGLHDFCHAQLCNDINRHVKDVTPQWVPDSQPSIPLDAEDQIGLVLCMLTSLYGGTYVRGRINASGDKALREHLDEVRALRISTTTS